MNDTRDTKVDGINNFPGGERGKVEKDIGKQNKETGPRQAPDHVDRLIRPSGLLCLIGSSLS